MQPYLSRSIHHIAFVVMYVTLDWASFVQPVFGLNITPWNPVPALGFVYWLKYGKKAAILWLVALFACDGIVRGFPGGISTAAMLSAWLIVGYGLIAEALRRNFSLEDIFSNRKDLFIWVSIIVVGTLINGTTYISLLQAMGRIPAGHWSESVGRYWIGDIVGILVSMPIIWMLASKQGRIRLREIVMRWETAGYVGLLILLLWTVFRLSNRSDFDYFYFLFLPIVWAAARQGLAGAALIALVLQLGVVTIVEWLQLVDMAIFELQMLLAVLALACFFIGVVVDEQRHLADELKQTLRLAAAGEMAAALAHELNQPMTALVAYGNACEQLLARGETGCVLRDAIHRMVSEAGRAANVVGRLRDFFRTGAMKLEKIEFSSIATSISHQCLAEFRAQGVVLDTDVESSVTVNADGLQIELVLRNLLGNAFDAVVVQPPGQRRIRLSAEVIEGGRLRVSVADSGPGISSSVAARLFEPFVSSKSSGMGLGLVLSRSIVEAHGGSLWAEVSDHGIFRFVLPLAEVGDYGLQ